MAWVLISLCDNVFIPHSHHQSANQKLSKPLTLQKRDIQLGFTTEAQLCIFLTRLQNITAIALPRAGSAELSQSTQSMRPPIPGLVWWSPVSLEHQTTGGNHGVVRLSNLDSDLQPPGEYYRIGKRGWEAGSPIHFQRRELDDKMIILVVMMALLITIITISYLLCFCGKTVCLEID